MFQDIYEWAGQHRAVDMNKAESVFATTDTIGVYMDQARVRVERNWWPDLDRDQLARETAEVFTLANTAYPFREGNGYGDQDVPGARGRAVGPVAAEFRHRRARRLESGLDAVDAQ